MNLLYFHANAIDLIQEIIVISISSIWLMINWSYKLFIYFEFSYVPGKYLKPKHVEGSRFFRQI